MDELTSSSKILKQLYTEDTQPYTSKESKDLTKNNLLYASVFLFQPIHLGYCPVNHDILDSTQLSLTFHSKYEELLSPILYKRQEKYGEKC